MCPSSNARVYLSFSVSMSAITHVVGKQAVGWWPGQWQINAIGTMESVEPMCR